METQAAKDCTHAGPRPQRWWRSRQAGGECARDIMDGVDHCGGSKVKTPAVEAGVVALVAHDNQGPRHAQAISHGKQARREGSQDTYTTTLFSFPLFVSLSQYNI